MKKTSLIVLFSIISIFSIAFIFPSATEKTVNIYDKIKVLNQIISLVNDNYVDNVNWDEALDGAFEGMLEKLDPHSSYISRDKLENVNEQFHGKFEGIGIEFDLLGGYITVISPIVDSPSDKVGLQPGDKIISIDGKDAFEITREEVFNTLRGPKGSPVSLTIRRQGLNETFEVEIIRDQIPIYSLISSFMINKEIGYMRLTRFASTTYDEVSKAVNDLRSKGMNKLIFDLRTNSGGYLEQAVNISDLFITSNDTIVYTSGRKNKITDSFKASSRRGFNDFSLIILINRWSASASEIVAGAVQDLDRGLILGETSFGKGLVQRQWPLRDGSAVRVTIARYYTPSGRLIQRPYNDGLRNYYQELNNEDREEILDSLRKDQKKFKTKKGRTVYGGGGITPDFFLPVFEYDSTISKIINNPERLAFNWATTFSKNLNKKWNNISDFTENFVITDLILSDFFEFVNNKGLKIDETLDLINNNYLKSILKSEIAGSKWGRSGYYQVFISNDPQVVSAISYFDDAKKFITFN
tara:strand:+ start:2988 stop:4565 length:1578 start_codon:yes stop_codon:yes gene_type:complete